MNISDIASPEYIAVDVNTRLGKVRSLFESENPKGIIVTRDGAYAGVLSERELLQSHVEDDTKVAALIKPSRNDPAPKVDRHEDIRETARMLVEGNTKVAPVFEDGELYGVISQNAILEAVIDNFSHLTVGDIYTESVVTVGEDDGVGKAINRLREHGVSRLPVLDDHGHLVGVVTTHDIADVVVRDMDKATRGERAGDRERILDMPVADVMNSPVETVTVAESVDVAVERMLEMDFGGLVVTPADDDEVVQGVVTKTDALRALTYTEEDRMDVQITNVKLLETLSRDSIREDISAVAEKYRKMQVQHAHVRFHEHKEKLRGTPLIQCQIRLRTNKGQMAGSGEGYGAENAFHVALDKLERNVLERKGVIRDEQYRGQLLRKLNNL
jgi:predicted transcriptional regulator/ribosome-associated translation inhibitor RaiA